ncbi:MAG: hypothetical protein QOG63_2330 [Thermoleophilaceae bacterium]|jgi:hypothetical protein|nr:hypothetical protein [Thermoleophilaceae bacterium]
MAVQPPVGPEAPHRDVCTVHPLEALDGVFIQVIVNGETAGYAFGATAEIAAENVARDIVPAAAARSSQR